MPLLTNETEPRRILSIKALIFNVNTITDTISPAQEAVKVSNTIMMQNAITCILEQFYYLPLPNE